MNSIIQAPLPMQAWLNKLPSQNVGTLYAKLRAPFSPIATWHKVPVWGQVCDGDPHKSAVGGMLYNDFPFHGKGWTYVAWRAEPDNPRACKSELSGMVGKPNRFNGGTARMYQCFEDDAWG